MTSPFEDEQAPYFVLVNDEEQHSIWPQSVDVPAGWRAVHGPASRADCLDFVEREWVDMRPLSIR